MSSIHFASPLHGNGDLTDAISNHHPAKGVATKSLALTSVKGECRETCCKQVAPTLARMPCPAFRSVARPPQLPHMSMDPDRHQKN